MIYQRQSKTVQLAERFREELLAERLPKGTPVMSVRQLAEHFAVSTVTANRILNLLAEQDFLYRKPQSGTFIKHDPQTVPVIAYAGNLSDPENTDPLLYDATLRLMEHFTELGMEPVLISYHTLRHPELAGQKLRKTGGLLVESAFIDESTLKALWNYSGRIAVIGNTYIEDRIPCSQVIPDFTEPLLEFNRFKPIDSYRKILIVQAGHRNSKAGGNAVLRMLAHLKIPENKIEQVMLETRGNIQAYMRASGYFSKRGDLPDRTLIFSLSEYFSQAIREVFSRGRRMPDILNFDNMEAYQKNTGKAYFTSIDRQMGPLFCRGLDLLLRQLKEPNGEQTVLQIPAKLVIRESVRIG